MWTNLIKFLIGLVAGFAKSVNWQKLMIWARLELMSRYKTKEVVDNQTEWDKEMAELQVNLGNLERDIKLLQEKVDKNKKDGI